MDKHPKFWGIHARPSQRFGWLLAALPFILIVAVYLVASDARLEANPQDKLLPNLVQMKDAMARMAFTEDRRSGIAYLL